MASKFTELSMEMETGDNSEILPKATVKETFRAHLMKTIYSKGDTFKVPAREGSLLR